MKWHGVSSRLSVTQLYTNMLWFSLNKTSSEHVWRHKNTLLWIKDFCMKMFYHLVNILEITPLSPIYEFKYFSYQNLNYTRCLLHCWKPQSRCLFTGGFTFPHHTTEWLQTHCGISTHACRWPTCHELNFPPSTDVPLKSNSARTSFCSDAETSK